MTGGTLTYAGADGLQLGSESFMTLAGGTAYLSGMTVNSATGGNGVSELAVTGGTLYLGAAGLAVNTPGATVFAQFGTGTVGASADWASSAPITLTPAGNTTFQTADASGAAHNITLNGALSGGGGLTVTGAGTLILAGHDTYTGATNVLSGILEITGSDSNSSSLSIANAAVCYLAGGSLSISGGITNNGIFKTSGSALLSLTGAFINNGVLDLINGPQTLPANFTNNGAVLTASSVQVQQLAKSGSTLTLTVQGYPQHTYQLQHTASLAAPVTWTNVGAAQAGMGLPLTFTDPAATGTAGFYQVLVAP
jgi:autotransporter-associated beta strand protein